ncbi:MAG: hypothetical protein P4L68_08070 [Methylovirgula sp.]|nr:hypothetical protein [Methylovirgula sp.]
MPKCRICLDLLRQAAELSLRAQALDEQVEKSYKVSRGCAMPAQAILHCYDADLRLWQKHVADHLAGSAAHV